ncbi:hypothetical protein [Variovorax sp. W6]|uniref:hypothetical protein n=1 Tax=Variovorax sp. W6 TaxID=3093895 RepID=UPI003D8035DA
MKYFLSVFSGEEVLREQEEFADFAEAIAACGEYYEPRARGSVLNFTTVVTGKQFMRSYAQLVRIDDLPSDVAPGSPQSLAAIKQDNAFSFARSYHFLIESEAGLEQAAQWQREEDED